MKSVVVGWMFGLGLLLSHVGCCSVRMMGEGCGAANCGGGCSAGCDTMDFGDRVVPFAGFGNRIANHIRSKNCSSGCGEIYWDEQINEPPVCDPCGHDGEFTGDSCRSCPTTLRRLRNLWNHQRFQPSNCDSCSSCGGDAGFSGASTCSNCSSGGSENDSMHMNLEPSQPEPIQSEPIQSVPTRSVPTRSIHIPPMQTPSMQSNPSRRSVAPQNDSSRAQPTPADRSLREAPPVLRNTPAPVPDPNAMVRPSLQKGQTAGSDTTNQKPSVHSHRAINSQQAVKAKPVAGKASQSVQGKPRLAANPRP